MESWLYGQMTRCDDVTFRSYIEISEDLLVLEVLAGDLGVLGRALRAFGVLSESLGRSWDASRASSDFCEDSRVTQ